jgi:preprotein translocase subunit YajC
MTMIIWCDIIMVIMDVYVIRPNTGQMNLHDKSHHIIMVIMDVYVIRPNTGQMNPHDKSHHIMTMIIWCDLSCGFICPVFGRIT